MDEPTTQRASADPGDIATVCLPTGRLEFGRYELIRELGVGGMGIVWLAQDRALGAPVALKMLREEMTREPTALRELKGEVIINRSLSHPNIVKTFDFVTNGRASAISMEYVEGTNLHRMKTDRAAGFFEPEDVAPWLVQLCAAMDYAHRQNIVHRDIKPANLLVNGRGELKVGDFGIGRTMTTTMLGATRNASGTPPYMSPQQTMGERAQPTDDIYAIGATVYDLLTGDPPFFRGSIRDQALAKSPPAMGERRGELGRRGRPIPREWEEAVAAALSKEAVGRPGSAAELRAVFEGRAKAVASPRSRRTAWPWLAGAGLTAAAAAWTWRGALAERFLERPVASSASAAPARVLQVQPEPRERLAPPGEASADDAGPQLSALVASGALGREEADQVRRALEGRFGDAERSLATRLVRTHTLAPTGWRDYSALVAPRTPVVGKLRPLLEAGIIRENEFGWLEAALDGSKGETEADLAEHLVDARDLTPADWRARTGLYPNPPVDPVVEAMKPLATSGRITPAEQDWLQDALRGRHGAEETLRAEALVRGGTLTVGQWRARTALAYPLAPDALADPGRWPPAVDLPLGTAGTARLLRVDPGAFLEGSPVEEKGRRSNEPVPAEVRIQEPFYLGVYEVTQAQYAAIMPRNPSYWRGHGDWPVDQVDWRSLTGPDGFLDRVNRILASRHAAALLADLPTNDEWEYACRAGTRGSFYRGGLISDLQRDPVLDTLANYSRSDTGSPQPVGSYAPNAWGFYDLLGNVAEWCRDRYVRGGSWQSNAAGCRIGWRTQLNPDADDDVSPTLGFRLLLRRHP